MRSDFDEPDLYPADAEEHEVTPEAKQHRMRAAVGTTLLVWGTSLLTQRALGIDIDTFVLGLGLGALAGWSQLRRYGWFVAGAIATGLGMAEVAGAIFNGAFGASISMFMIAAGFAAIYVRYPRRSMWALVPAGIQALVGVAAFGVGLIGLLPSVLGKFMLPLLLVGGGALLLFRHSLPPKTVKIGLAAVAAMFVLVGTTSVPGDSDHEFNINVGGPPDRSVVTQPMPLGAGDTLVLGGGGSGDIEFRVGEAPTIQINGDEHGPGVALVRREGTRVLVGKEGFFGSDQGVDYVVTVPAGVKIDVDRGSGSVSGHLAGVEGNIRTESGDVDLELEDGGAEGFADDGPLDIETDSGSVTIDSELVLNLDLGGDGDVVVNRENVNGRFRSAAGTNGLELEVDTESGDIEIDMPSSAPTPPAAPSAPTPPSAPTSG
jgi:hypothetical protein